MTLSAAAAAVVLFAAGGACAAPAAYNWTGFYAGVQAGGGWGRDHFEPVGENFQQLSGVFVQGLGTVIVPSTTATHDVSLTRSGFVVGGQLGYDWQIGDNVVVGAVADLATGVKADDVAVTGTLPATVLTQAAPYTLTRRDDERWHATVRARVGFTTDRFLIYATGGVAFNDMKYTSRDTITLTGPNPALPAPIKTADPGLFSAAPNVDLTSSTTTAEARQNRRGWTLGGGVEWAWTDNLHFGMEYRHEDYGTKDLVYHLVTTVPGPGAHPGFDVASPSGDRAKFSEDRVVVTFNYHFGQ
jgi:outer membrane immunogenic protein